MRETQLRRQRSRRYTQNQTQEQDRDYNIGVRRKLMSLLEEVRHRRSRNIVVDVSQPDEQQERQGKNKGLQGKMVMVCMNHTT